MSEPNMFQKSTPDHVPPELIRPYPYTPGATTTADPHSFIAEIHKGPRVIWAERAYHGIQGAWIPRRAEDLEKIYFDNDHYRMRGFAPFAGFIGDSWYLVPAEYDPPEHSVMRAMINPLFSPKRMAALEDKIRDSARKIIARLRPHGSCELMTDFAFEFPIHVFLELMGLPIELTPQFLTWEHQLIHGTDMAQIKDATRAVVTYLRGEIEARRSDPKDDLITFGVNAEVEGRKLSEDELVGFCFNLFVGGLDTVSTHIGSQFRHLAENREHQGILRQDPSRIPAAIDEMMRAFAAVATSRECTRETRIGDVTVMPGDKVLMPTYLANRDPEIYERPEEVILDRKARNFSFGYGIHLCIGMHLARREMRIALEEALSGWPEFGITPGAVIVSNIGAIIQPVALPLTWTSR